MREVPLGQVFSRVSSVFSYQSSFNHCSIPIYHRLPEMCDSPDQAAHYHNLEQVSPLTRHLAGYIGKYLLKGTIFWDITPCSPLNVNRRFGETYHLHLQGRRLLDTCFYAGSCLVYSSTLKMEALFSSETSIDIERTTRRYIPEDSTLHNHRCENLKSYKYNYCLMKCHVCAVDEFCNNEFVF
jgi:hypothetical protein